MFKRKKQKQTLHQREYSLDDGIPAVQDLFIPDGLEEEKDYLYLGLSRYCRIFAISKWPRDVHVGWLDEIFQVGNVDLAVYVRPVPDRKVVKDLTGKVVSAQSQWIVEKNRGSIMRLPELENVIRDLETIREAIQCNRDRMFHVTVLIAVHGTSEEDLNMRCERVEDILARRATEVRALTFRQLEALKSVLPAGNLCIYGRGTFRNLTLGGTASVLPVSSSAFSHPTGAFLGYTSAGSPVFFDPFIGPPWLPNQHVAVFGYPGSGKSVTLKIFCGRLSLMGVKVLIFDPEGEYREAAKNLYGGEIVPVAAGVPAGMNPLEIEVERDPDTKKEYINISDKVADVRALVATIVRGFANRPLEPEEIAVLEEAVRELYAERGITSDPASLYEPGGRKLPDGSFAVGGVRKRMPTLSDLHAKLGEKPGTEKLCLILKPFLRGKSLGMFDSETERDLTAPVVVFDLSRIRDEFTKFYAMFVVLTWAWHRFALRHTGKKMVVIDEAWMFVKWPDSAQFLETLARRGRKHDTALVVASQYVEEFLAREEGRSVIDGCATNILLGQNPSVVDQVVEVFKLPKGMGERLQIFTQGRCIIKVGGKTLQEAGGNMAEVQVTALPYEMPFVRTGGKGEPQ
ncbi:DUF87 domain-containing protein [Desulfofundulus sp. TPOSR]|uniref:VirB4 family type IV secretion system protein n=1 Tax=Desulfofundulus sp. TPOSR TaxID=2714340 RepID=UPI00140D8BA2|nr:ATP-binding protein [Desulfofundulus sp. TPOSR]NHM28946.1 DUF87 domain-containing protein [Desulfofundulus sp. TPOSR]